MISCTDSHNISEKGDGSRTEIAIKNTFDDASISSDKRNLKSCGLLYPELMKTKSATIELQEKQDDLDEVVEDFEGEPNYFEQWWHCINALDHFKGNPEFSHDGSLINEIKIAEVIEMMCEVAEENDFHSLNQEFRAAVIEVENDPTDIDDEVAQLTRLMDLEPNINEEQFSFKVNWYMIKF